MTDPTHNAPSIKTPIDDNLLEIKISIAPQINFACHQNSVPLIRDITIINNTKNDFLVLAFCTLDTALIVRDLEAPCGGYYHPVSLPLLYEIQASPPPIFFHK